MTIHKSDIGNKVVEVDVPTMSTESKSKRSNVTIDQLVQNAFGQSCVKVENNANVVNQRSKCKITGCTSESSGYGSDLCMKHRVKKSKCLVNGCEKNAQYQGFCRTHGGRKCSVKGCTNRIANGGRGKCIDHAVAVIPSEWEHETNT